MAEPPFLIPECPPTPEAVERAHSESDKGSTLDKGTAPVAELRIHYETQFRFSRFYEVKTATPYWTNTPTEPLSKEDLTNAVGAAPSGWLDAGDRFVHVDQSNRQKVKVGASNVTLVLGNAERHADGPDQIWLPVAGTLPAHARGADPKAKWQAPAILKNSPPANQWGIRGTMDLTLDPCRARKKDGAYKNVCVWERWKSDRFTSGMAVLPPGTYAGYPKPMGNHSASKEDMLDYPAIWVGYEWEESSSTDDSSATDGAEAAGGKWLKGVHGWRVKNPSSTILTTSIFIHPGNHPSWFLGCQSPGFADKQTEWGFVEKKDTWKTMWEILDKLGVTKDSFVKNGTYPAKKNQKWVVIRVTANEDAIKDDGWKKQRIWLNLPKTDSSI